jgi:hypothetical protein
LRREGEYIKVIDHGYTRTGKQLAEAKLKKRKELQTLTEPHL